KRGARRAAAPLGRPRRRANRRRDPRSDLGEPGRSLFGSGGGWCSLPPWVARQKRRQLTANVRRCEQQDAGRQGTPLLTTQLRQTPNSSVVPYVPYRCKRNHGTLSRSWVRVGRCPVVLRGNVREAAKCNPVI